MTMAKTTGRPTCRAAVNTVAAVSSGVSGPPFTASARSQCLITFSVITIAASTSTPMAMAKPDRLIRLEVSPVCRIRMNEIRILTGRGNRTIKMLRK